MAQYNPNLHLRSLEELHAVIVSRQNGCLRCEDKAPTCPDCESGEFCSFTIPTCTSCAQAICVKDDSSQAPPPVSNKPNTGAIVGGVIAGLAFVALATYLVWRFFIKAKKQRDVTESYIEAYTEKGTSEKTTSNTRQTNRDSTHTVHSIASTVLTRASNIIQIAYIPGVTNRATPAASTPVIPPVPPIPTHASDSAATTPASFEDQHFFVPGELRDSTYSGISGYSDRISVARNSYAARSSIAPSIASTIYGKNAVVVAPAQTGMRAKAAVVSVKSGPVGIAGNTPPVPSVDYEKYATARPKSHESQFSVGSTFLNANTAAAAPAQRVQVVRVGTGLRQVSVGSSKASSSTDEPCSPSLPSASTVASDYVSVMSESPTPHQGPFPEAPSPGAGSRNNSLSVVIEEAARRAAAGPDRRYRRTSSHERERERSPFGDEHATRD